MTSPIAHFNGQLLPLDRIGAYLEAEIGER